MRKARCGVEQSRAEQRPRESVEFVMASVAGRVAFARFTRCACFLLLCWSGAGQIAVLVLVSVSVVGEEQ